jgi:hypothetical protein
MAITFTNFDCFYEDIAEKVHNLGSDTLKITLSNTAPSAANTVIGDITGISTGNGYAGPITVTVTSSSQSSGVYKLVFSDITILASGGSIGPFRYFVLWNDTAASDQLISWGDYASSVTLADGESFILDFDATNGALQIKAP